MKHSTRKAPPGSLTTAFFFFIMGSIAFRNTDFTPVSRWLFSGLHRQRQSYCVVVPLIAPLLPTVNAIVVAWVTVVVPIFDVPVTVIVQLPAGVKHVTFQPAQLEPTKFTHRAKKNARRRFLPGQVPKKNTIGSGEAFEKDRRGSPCWSTNPVS